MPGADFIVGRYFRFRHELPTIAGYARLNADALTFVDCHYLAAGWLQTAAS